MTSPPTMPAPADDFDREHHSRVRRTRIRRILVCLPITVAVVVAAVLLQRDPDLTWPLPVAMLLAVVTGGYSLAMRDAPDRPMPDTPLEVGRVVSSRVVKLGSRVGDAVSRVKVIVEPFDGSGILVHGELDIPVAKRCDPPPGTVIGFRRHPTMRHLVRLEEEPPRAAVTVAATVGDARAAEQLMAEGEPDTAGVTGVTVGTGIPDGRWEVEVALTLSDGRPAEARCLIPPEMLVRVAPGTELSVVRRDNADGSIDCVIVFPDWLSQL